MEMKEVQSSINIKAIGYDPDTKILAVTFKSGNTYNYADVPQEKYDGFMAAESKGGFFGREIKPHFACQKLEPPEPATEPA